MPSCRLYVKFEWRAKGNCLESFGRKGNIPSLDLKWRGSFLHVRCPKDTRMLIPECAGSGNRGGRKFGCSGRTRNELDSLFTGSVVEDIQRKHGSTCARSCQVRFKISIVRESSFVRIQTKWFLPVVVDVPSGSLLICLRLSF